MNSGWTSKEDMKETVNGSGSMPRGRGIGILTEFLLMLVVHMLAPLTHDRARAQIPFARLGQEVKFL